MSYNNRFGNGGRGGGGGYGGGRGGRGGGRINRIQNRGPGAEVCAFYLDDRCTRAGCNHPHFVKRLGVAHGHTSAVKDVVLWEGKQQAFTCSNDGTIRLWDCATWKEIAQIPVCNVELDIRPTERDKVKKMSEGIAALHLEGSHLFVGYEEPIPQLPGCPVGKIKCWNLDNPAAPPLEFMVSPEMPFAHYRNVWALTVAKNPATGELIVLSGSGDGRIRYWTFDAAMGGFKCGGLMEGHSRGITRLKTVQLGGTMALISSSMDHTIRIWDLSTFKCGTVLTSANEGHANVVMDLDVWVNGAEQYLISGGLDKQVIVWNLAPPFAKVFADTVDLPILSLSVATDGQDAPLLLMGHDDGTISVKELPSFNYKMSFGKVLNNVGHTQPVRRIIPGPLHTFFTVSMDNKMMAWQVTGKAADIPVSN
ncbi:hypothetical protein DYB37_008269 [Aphanomyces astaci]|uniref:C3H1-type domain-containing protein n=1 Tax=Aphanomyces astaci TaxID=112090 RepID=A0A3R7AKC8_APHAT|nr:hypothetical protein DYB35_007457 [Aphanomyces astaci]RHZ16739.1 hypothetical protein DYB37_008269 [Aphanomyces astaci]